MSPDLDDLLCSRYPKLFADRHNADSSMGRGFTCGDGWFELVDQLCRDVQTAADAGEIRQPLARQVKEANSEPTGVPTTTRFSSWRPWQKSGQPKFAKFVDCLERWSIQHKDG